MAHYYVAQFDAKAFFTGQVYGPFPTIERATEFQETASTAGYYYARLRHESLDKQEVSADVAARSNKR